MNQLKKFCCEHPDGTELVKQYSIKEIAVTGQMSTRHVVRRLGKNGKPGGIVVHWEELFDAIDEWHRQDGRLGQERTWTYCRAKYQVL